MKKKKVRGKARKEVFPFSFAGERLVLDIIC